MSTTRNATATAVILPQDQNNAVNQAIDRAIPVITDVVTAALPILANAGGSALNACATTHCPSAAPVVCISTTLGITLAGTPEAGRSVASSVQRAGDVAKTSIRGLTSCAPSLDNRVASSC